jgi:hypothetical protein
MNARRTLAALSLLALAAPAARAADDKIPLWSGTPVTILRTDGTTETAKFHATAQDPPRLLLFDTDARHWSAGVKTREIPLADVAAIEGPVGTRFRGKHVLWTTLIGAAAGGFVGYLTQPKQGIAVVMPAFGPAPPPVNIDTGEAVALGIGVGAVTGAVLGAITAPTVGPVRRWTITPAGDAVLEPAQVPAR